MRKYHEILVEAIDNKQVGNHFVLHQVEVNTWRDDLDGKTYTEEVDRAFYYHRSPICLVNDHCKMFKTSHAGWFTTSTDTAIQGYREYFLSRGYQDMTPRLKLGEVYVISGKNCERKVNCSHGVYWVNYKGEKWEVQPISNTSNTLRLVRRY